MVLVPFGEPWSRFFHSRCSQSSISVAVYIRVFYGCLLFSNLYGVMQDFDTFFVDLLPLHRARSTIGSPWIWSVWEWIPDSSLPLALRGAFILWMAHAVCLALGYPWPRFQCGAIFWWHTQFHAHNGVLWNGEDVAFRLFSFYLLFFPLHHGTIVSVLGKRHPPSSDSWPMVSVLMFL